MAHTVYHVRRKLRRQRGNQFYRDKSDRGRGTYCGADCGEYDVSHGSKIAEWTRADGELMVPCPECVMLRNRAKAGTAVS